MLLAMVILVVVVWVLHRMGPTNHDGIIAVAAYFGLPALCAIVYVLVH